jgi:hypothetical protein
MEHPLIPDLSTLSLDDTMSKLNDLRSKLNIAARMGNHHVCNQIRMAIESYEARYQVLMREQLESASKQIDNLTDKIDIAK